MSVREKLLVVAAIPPELRARLAEDYELVEYAGAGAAAGALPAAPGFRVAVTTSVGGAGEELMASLPDLGLILCNGTGLENIDLQAAARRGVVVRNTPDVVTEDTADFAVGLIFALLRRMVEGDRFVRAGRWGPERMTPSRRVSGRTLGIVGLGRIGNAVARRAAGIGMEVLYTGPRPKAGAQPVYVADLLDLAGRVDVLMLCCPGGEATRGLVDGEVLRRLGPEGFLINVARGSVVDEPALVQALGDGTIAGAALDVFASEPAVPAELRSLDNVVLEPHYATVTVEARQAMATLLADAVERFLAGRPVPDAAAGPGP